MSGNAYYETEDGFLFPFQPYDVQHQFMQNLYNTLELKQHGIFESPTGTGKSLSIICGSLKWLKDEQVKKKLALQTILSDTSVITTSTDWFSGYSTVKQKLEDKKNAKEELEAIEYYERKILKIRNAPVETCEEKNNFKGNLAFSQPLSKRQKTNIQQIESFSDEDNEISEGVRTKMEEVQYEMVKIFYASRTHSQLQQFINELKKTPYSSCVTVTILGSRSNLCVNDCVRKLKKQSLINEKCSELLKKKSTNDTGSSSLQKNESSCQFYFQRNIKQLENVVLRQVLDIEDIVKRGKDLKACPYFTVRKVIPDAEMVVLPYNILLHKATRDSYGISLKNNIVIIDEAHNLLEAISNMYSADIKYECLLETHFQLKCYKCKYITRFSAKSLMYIKQLIVLVESFINYISKVCKSQSEESDIVKVMTYQEFISVTGTNEINFFDLIQFCDENYIGNKLMGFASGQSSGIHYPNHNSEKNMANTKSTKASIVSFLDQIKGETASSDISEPVKLKQDLEKHGSASSFFIFYEFLKTLTLPSDAGSFMLKQTQEGCFLKFLHLNPSLHFKNIVEEARSVILAGGTMEPVEDFMNQLFSQNGVPQINIRFHSYSHVVPAENIFVLPVSTGFQNVVLDFTYKSRSNDILLEELERILLTLVAEVPGGLVCFFPSYSYENYVYSHMCKNGTLIHLSQKKALFREPKEAGAVDSVLNNYANVISSKSSGAILFCVVNGKMSEGINFSDDLCRCVVMIGMPYPNKNSPELKEKLKKLRDTYSHKQEMEYCSNLCMKAVNQSIGRAIRHKNDYAAIVLLDLRYSEPVVQGKLPLWLKNRLSHNLSISSALADLRNFFFKFKNKKCT